MEKDIEIKTSDDHLIYGVLNNKEESKKLIIFVHGITGHRNEHQFYNAAKFFPEKGFATFRFDLYSGEKKGRNLVDCTVETHFNDLNAVIDHFKDDYDKIYLVGHSLGGPVVLLSETDLVDSIVLWDPSFDILKDLSDVILFDERINMYILKWSVEFLLSPEMVKSWEGLGEESLKHFDKPTKIICAGQGILHKDWKKKVDSIKTETEFCMIEEAGHCFDEEGAEGVLFTETLKWFDR